MTFKYRRMLSCHNSKKIFKLIFECYIVTQKKSRNDFYFILLFLQFNCSTCICHQQQLFLCSKHRRTKVRMDLYWKVQQIGMYQ